VAARFGEFRCSFDAGQSAADDHDGCGHRHLGQLGAQPDRLFEFAERIGEFGRTRHAGRYGAGTADGIHEIVVTELDPGGQCHAASGGVDVPGAVDHQLYSVMEQPAGAAVRRHGVVAARHQLVQPDPFDELRPGIDQCDRGLLGQAVGRQDTGVAAAEDDDAGSRGAHVCSLEVSAPLFGPSDLKTPTASKL
jgi:hypothetical protein